MNREEFELMFSSSIEVQLIRLHQIGLFAIECKCGRNYCEGWKMQSILNMSHKQRMEIPVEDLQKHIYNVHYYVHGKCELIEENPAN